MDRTYYDSGHLCRVILDCDGVLADSEARAALYVLRRIRRAHLTGRLPDGEVTGILQLDRVARVAAGPACGAPA